MSNLFQAQCQITAIIPDVPGRWHALANINFYGPSTYSFDATTVSIGDTIILQSTNPSGQTHRFTVDQIDSAASNSIDFWFVYNDTASSPTGMATGTGIISEIYSNDMIAVPSGFWCQSDEFLTSYINTKNAEMFKLGGNTIIQGQSGFASHYIDGSGNNDVNSYIEYNSDDGVHYHRIQPKVDANYIDIRIGFQFPSTFTGLVDTGNAFEFYGKADDGSGDTVNVLTLTKLVGTDGTEYAVTGKSISTSSRTLIALTKTEVDTILNPFTGSSSSSSSNIEWTDTDAGKLVFAEFRLFGNDGDNIYLDNDKDFMHIA